MLAKIRVKKLAFFKKNVLLYSELSFEQDPLHHTPQFHFYMGSVNYLSCRGRFDTV